ncbi:lipase [Streptomyces sp. P38-E01]|uniref:Lipase n=1 Tax=Streptomyces tardus TaxID=2780544 RepID=A0A949JKD8_9ACTN|nr:GDSL-type esterase/lipase family protein [Streptomyces tardus]MBU7596776.1 lipase [Streptomyces tardus]
MNDEHDASGATPQGHWTSTVPDETYLHGALELERTAQGLRPHRLPARARAQVSDGYLSVAESQPSGVRLVFGTEASSVELDTVRTKMAYEGAPPRPDGRYDLLVDGEPHDTATTTGGNVLLTDMSGRTPDLTPGPVGTVRFATLPPGPKTVEIWLPYNEITDLVALRTDAPVHPVAPGGRRWLHHGSSISQGSDAASAATIWPALAARSAGVRLTNLGFGGNAVLDPYTARAMRDTPADVISIKIGINIVNKDVMRLRAFGPAVHGFLDTVRDGHPHTPLLVVSPILCPIHEDTPGPLAPDLTAIGEGRLSFLATGDPAEVESGKLTLNVIRAELARIVEQRAAEDPHLHYLDGRELYGEQDHERLPLPDRLHPDAAAHEHLGERFAKLVLGPGGKLAEA